VAAAAGNSVGVSPGAQSPVIGTGSSSMRDQRSPSVSDQPTNVVVGAVVKVEKRLPHFFFRYDSS